LNPNVFGRIGDVQPIGRERLPTILSGQQERRLLKIATYSNEILQLRNAAILYIFLKCGLKIFELINLRLSDYSPSIACLAVTGIKKKRRIIPLGREIARIIDRYLQLSRPRLLSVTARSDRLFITTSGCELDRGSISKIIGEYGKTIHLSYKLTPTILRHTFAVRLLEKGLDISAVQKLMGHVSLNNLEAYANVNRRNIMDSYIRHHPRATHPKRGGD